MTKYNELTPELIDELKAIVGEDNCHAGEAVSEDYSHDEMPIYGTRMPEAVCFPESTEQVSGIMRLCNEHSIPVTVRGAGTGLVGGSTPLEGGVVLCTMHMNQILEYDMNNLNVRIQPGVRLCDLAADALTHGLMYPPDPGEKTGSVGGNVSTNAGGMRAVKYGTTRDYVLAMTVVLPSGEILDLGRAVTKTSSGYSLLHLMVGSEGTLGVITELTMKLVPEPKEDISFLLPFEHIEAAISAVPQIKLAGLDPQSIEFMERDIVDSSANYTGNKIIPTVVQDKEVGAYILVTLDGNDQDEIFQRAETLAEVADEAGHTTRSCLATPTTSEMSGQHAALSLPSSRRTPSCSMRWTSLFPSTASPNSSALCTKSASSRVLPSVPSDTQATATFTFTAARTAWSRRSSFPARPALCRRRTASAPIWAVKSPASTASAMRRRITCVNPPAKPRSRLWPVSSRSSTRRVSSTPVRSAVRFIGTYSRKP